MDEDLERPKFRINEIPELKVYFLGRRFTLINYVSYNGKKKKKELLELQDNEFGKWENATRSNNFTPLHNFYQDTYQKFYAFLKKFSMGNINVDLFIELKYEIAFNLNEGLYFLKSNDFSRAFIFLGRAVFIYDSLLLFRLRFRSGSRQILDQWGFDVIVSRYEVKLGYLILDYMNNIRSKVKELEIVNHYNSYINLFSTAANDKDYNQAIKYYGQAEVYKKKIPKNENYIYKELEEIKDSLFNSIMSETIFHIKKIVLDLGTKYSKLSIQEISEKTGIDLEFLLIKTIKTTS